MGRGGRSGVQPQRHEDTKVRMEASSWRTWRPVRLPAPPLRHSELVEESRPAARSAQGRPWRFNSVPRFEA
jgi:hypothetical protein